MLSSRAIFGFFAFAVVAYACSDSRDPGARTVTALESAQCDVKLFSADSATCAKSFETCRATQSLTVCRDAYVACLPAVPSISSSGKGGDVGERSKGDDDKGRGRPGSSSVANACATTRAACIEATSDPSGCGPTAVECVRRAYRDAYVAKCADAKTRCDDGDYSAESCTTITARCEQGESPATTPDGQCAAPAAPAPQPSGITSDAAVDSTTPDSGTTSDASAVDSAVPDSALPDAQVADSGADAS